MAATGYFLNEICKNSSLWFVGSYFFTRVSVQGVKSLGGHVACLCRGFEFYEVKKSIIIFQKENGNTFTLLIIFIVKSLQKEQNSTNLLLWPPIGWNKPAITPKCFNSLDTNSRRGSGNFFKNYIFEISAFQKNFNKNVLAFSSKVLYRGIWNGNLQFCP